MMAVEQDNVSTPEEKPGQAEWLAQETADLTHETTTSVGEGDPAQADKKAVKKDWIEDLVVNYTMKAIMNDEVMERLIDTLMELQKKEKEYFI